MIQKSAFISGHRTRLSFKRGASTDLSIINVSYPNSNPRSYLIGRFTLVAAPSSSALVLNGGSISIESFRKLFTNVKIASREGRGTSNLSSRLNLLKKDSSIFDNPSEI